MFGTYRFLLACMVVCGHTWYFLMGRLSWLGTYAVFGFYLLSGYLMTRVLHETYGYGPRALGRFLGNRALRVYPAYWGAMAVMVALLIAIPGVAGNQTAMVFLPGDAAQWLYNAVILGIDVDYIPRLVPPSWSLHLELVFYIMLGLGLSRTRTTTALWLAASVAWTAYANLTDIPFGDRYASVLGASLPFAAGAGVYYLPRLPTGTANRVGLLAAAAFFLHALIAGLAYASTSGVAFYASLALTTIAVTVLRDARTQPRWRRLDTRLGDLAYPIFLLHMAVAYFVQWVFPAAATPPRLWFLTTMPPLLLASVLLNRLVEKPIEKARVKVRGVEIGALKTARSNEAAEAARG
ncbi:MAG: acyltransferase [Deltaproteobacteria bacterium]|nr:acyltransferase [Deltaproteobacteria bacterium]